MIGTKHKIAITFTLLVAGILSIFGIIFNTAIESDFVKRLNLEMQTEISSMETPEKIRDSLDHVIINNADGTPFCTKGIFKEINFEPAHNSIITFGEDHYLISRQVTHTGEEICSAEKVSNVKEELQRWFDIYLYLSAIFIIFSYGIGIIFGHAILAKIREINNISDQFHAGDNVKIPTPNGCGSKDEICKLIGTLNNLFERVNTENERLSRFSSDVAHEFKNALFEIRSQVQLSLRKEDYRECLEQMQERIGSLDTLVESLLTLAQTENEQITQGMCDIAPIITELPIITQNKTHTLSLETPEVTQRLNKGLLEIALTNLIGNAIKFTPEHKNISIKLTKDSISIRDEGIGIAPEELEDIWGRFHKSSHSRTYGTGHGLGLSITREIIERIHGWKIEVISTKWEGSEFKILF